MKFKYYFLLLLFVIADNLYSQISVIAPNAKDTIVPGEPFNIQWTNANGAPVDIYYQNGTGAQWTEIISGVSSTSYLWNVPALNPGDLRIVVSNKAVSAPRLIWDKENAHGDEIRSVELSKNGRLIVTTGRDNKIALWDIEKKSLAASNIINYITTVYCARFYNNDKDVIIAGDSTFISWNIQKNNFKLYPASSYFDGLVRTCEVDPSSKIAAFGTSKGEVILYSLETNEIYKRLKSEPGDIIAAVRFSHDGTKIIYAGYSGIIYSADWQTDTPVKEFTGHGNANGQAKLIWSLDFSRDDTKFVSGGTDGTVRLWDYTQATPVQTFVLPGDGLRDVRGVRYSHNGSFILSGSLDSTLRQWDISENTENVKARLNHGGQILCIDMNAAGDTLVSAGRDNSVKVWKNAVVSPYSDTVECAVKHRLVFSLNPVNEIVGNISSANIILDYHSPYADSSSLMDLEAKIIYPADMLEITNALNSSATYKTDTAAIAIKTQLKDGIIGTVETRALQTASKNGSISLSDVIFDSRNDYKIESKSAEVSLSELCPGYDSRNTNFTDAGNSLSIQEIQGGGSIIARLNLITTSDYTLKIFDISAKCIFRTVLNPTKSGENDVLIDISKFSSGVYAVLLNWESKQLTSKFVKP